MVGRSKIDDDQLRALWATEATRDQIGEKFFVSGAAVSARARKLGLPSRAPGGRKRPKPATPVKAETAKAQPQEKPLPAMPPHPFFTPHHDRRILDAGGYAGLADLAAEWGKPVSLLLQRRHQIEAA